LLRLNWTSPCAQNRYEQAQSKSITRYQLLHPEPSD
jgi:hypothetical protein